jgi:hypothetical protein
MISDYGDFNQIIENNKIRKNTSNCRMRYSLSNIAVQSDLIGRPHWILLMWLGINVGHTNCVVRLEMWAEVPWVCLETSES